jgi:hypothetical protein
MPPTFLPRTNNPEDVEHDMACASKSKHKLKTMTSRAMAQIKQAKLNKKSYHLDEHKGCGHRQRTSASYARELPRRKLTGVSNGQLKGQYRKPAQL